MNKNLLFLMVCAMLSTLTASAYDAKINDVFYDLNTSTKKALVTSGATKYTGNVTIPDAVTYNDVTYRVTEIGNRAFYSCSGLTSVTIPNSVTSIGSSAFWGCTGLTSVTIGKNVTSIGISAFYNCTGLTSVTIPNSVTSIGSSAFYNCTGLTSVTIGKNVSSIGSGAFSGCNNISSLEIYCKEIGNWFKGEKNIQNLVIGDEVTSIGSSAFYNCTGLTSVTIGKNVTSIGSSAFYNCTGLTSVTIGKNVTSIGKSAFEECTGLITVTLGNNLARIGYSAFRNCTGLTLIDIPNSVTNIDDFAFFGCTGLTTITLGNRLTNIGYAAFYNCAGLTSIDIPNSVSDIGERAFSGCTGLASVTIGSGITFIGSEAFDGCSGLSYVELVDLSAWCEVNLGKDTGLNSGRYYSSTSPFCYAHHLYVNGEEVKDLVIPEGAKIIKDHVFEQCTFLTSVVIPEGVTSIEGNPFSGCTSLHTVTIPSSLTEISSNAFPEDLDKLVVNVTNPVIIQSLCTNQLGLDSKSSTNIFVPEESYDEYVNNSNLSKYTIIAQTSVWKEDGVVVVTTEEAGDLALELTLLDDEDIRNLKIVGPLNAKDISYLREGSGKLANLQQLDLSEVTLVPDDNTPYSLGEAINSSWGGDMHAYMGTYYYISDHDEVSTTGGSNGLGGSYSYYHVYSTSLAGAFENSNILRVALPNSAKNIGPGTFRNSRVQMVKTKAPVTSVGRKAFQNCKTIREIDLSEASIIESHAFNGCINLNSVGCLKKVETLGVSAFENCTSLDFGEDGLDLPLVNDIPVGTFYNNILLKKVNFSDSLASIGGNAFAGCTSLNHIVLPNSCTTVGLEAFADCSSLDDMTVSSELMNVSASFIKNTPLSSLDAEGGVYYLQHIALTPVEKSPTSLVFRTGTATIANDFASGCNKSSLTSITLPSTLLRIGDNAFGKIDNYSTASQITSLQLPDGLQEIGTKAFCNALSTKSLTIPESVRSIGEDAFASNNTLTSLTFNAQLKPVYDLYDTKIDMRSLFGGCTNLAKVTIGAKVCRIPCYMFNGCTGLILVTSEDRYNTNTALRIGYGAFSYCTNLSRVLLPAETDSIGNSVFENCSALKQIDLPQGLCTIGQYAFRGCTGLTSIVIPNNVTSIGDFAFSGCQNLSSLEFHCKEIGNWLKGSTYVQNVVIGDEVRSIGEDAFRGCKDLTSIVIGNGVTSIGESAFSGCTGLTSVTISNSVTTIGNSAFSGCSGITSIVIPNSVTSIGNSAFSWCTGLSSISIPNSVTTIGNRAFSGCTHLTSIVIPNSVISIGSSIFDKCEHLSFVELHCTEIGSLFKDSEYVHVQNIVLGDEVRSIGEDAFRGCKDLTSIVIGNGVTSIGNSAFRGCVSLSSITLPATIEQIGKDAFYNCSTLNTVTSLNRNPQDVDSKAFYDVRNKAILYVPYKTSQLYKSKTGWSVFANIQELPNTAATFTAQDKIIKYGDEIPELTYIHEGVEADGTPILTCEATSQSPVGTYPIVITQGSVTGEELEFVNGTLTIKKAPLTITAKDYTIKWGDELPDFEAVYDGLKNNETPQVALTSFSISCGATSMSEVGTYDIVVTATSGNYELTLVQGTLTITEPDSHTLLYLVDGEVYKSSSLKYGATITPESEPTKEGYTFSGWSEIPATMPSQDVTVTGTFTVNNYTLTYMVDGETYKTFEVEYGSAIIPESVPEKEGYAFSGWSEIPVTMPSQDITVTGTFNVINYMLTYMVDGEAYKTFEVEYGSEIIPESEPTKEGYTFSGWSEIPVTMPSQDVTVTGTFTVNNYTLTYMVDGEAYKTFEVEYGSEIIPESEPTKEGYTFSGWSEIPETMPANDVVVTGTFSLVDAVSDINKDECEYQILTSDGRLINKLQKGLNIIRFSNGSTRKVMVK